MNDAEAQAMTQSGASRWILVAPVIVIVFAVGAGSGAGPHEDQRAPRVSGRGLKGERSRNLSATSHLPVVLRRHRKARSRLVGKP